MKKPLIGLGLCGLLAAPTSGAVPGNLTNASNLTTAGVSIGGIPPSSISNPALLKLSLGERNWALHGFRLPSFAVEIGPVDDFADTLESLEDDVDAAEEDGEVTLAEGAAIQQRYQGLMVEIGDKANLAVDVSMPVPTLPIVFQAFDGVMALHLGAAASIDADIIDGPIEADLPNDEIDTNGAVYLRSGLFYELAVDYGRNLMPLRWGPLDGTLSVGGRIKAIQGELSRQVAALDEDGEDDEDTALDRAGDNYDLNQETSLGIGADVGVGFSSERLNLGVTLRNLIPASFGFAALGVDCGQKPTATERQDCQSSRPFVEGYTVDGTDYPGEVDASEKFKLAPQLVVETSYVLGAGFTAFSTLELNKVKNIARNDYQWFNLGVNYSGPWWLPAMRLGYRSNLAGSKLDLVSLGLNLFRIINIEAFQALDSVDYDGDSTPRAAGISIGIGGRF